jgi:NADH-quinone oxidoreductase subunit J
MEAVIFYVLGVIVLGSALMVVFLRRPMHNVLFMIITMIGLAGLFVLLFAEFIALVQIVVYAGAVMVLFLFVIMLLNLDRITLPDDPRKVRWWVGVCLAVLLPMILVPVFVQFHITGGEVPKALQAPNTQTIAEALFTTYLLPFEVASVLLLAAIMGAVMLARKRSDDLISREESQGPLQGEL